MILVFKNFYRKIACTIFEKIALLSSVLCCDKLQTGRLFIRFYKKKTLSSFIFIFLLFFTKITFIYHHNNKYDLSSIKYYICYRLIVVSNQYKILWQFLKCIKLSLLRFCNIIWCYFIHNLHVKFIYQNNLTNNTYFVNINYCSRPINYT